MNLSSRLIYMQIKVHAIHYKVNVKGNELQKFFSLQITLDFSKQVTCKIAKNY